MTHSQSFPVFQPIKMMDVELSQPLVDIENLDGYTALKALVRLHGVSLGYVQLGVTNGCCTAAALGQAILERHSWPIIHHLISDGLASPMQGSSLCLADLVNVAHPAYTGPFPSVTVVVCTRNRTTDLAICLDALCRLNYPALELMVVDNAPTNEQTRHLVLTNYPTVRYVYEPRPGLSWARNRAIVEVQGEIIAFTDDDVIVDPGWVSALAQTFAENPGVMAVTGLVVPYELETDSQILFECHGGFGRGFERQWYRIDPAKGTQTATHHGAGIFGTGANMAFRRSLFDYIDHFDPALGVGTVTQGGEDLEMFFRLLQEGYTLVYEPNALVRHRHRRDYVSLKRQLTNNGIGLASYHVQAALTYRHQRAIFIKLHLWWLWRWHIKRTLRALTRPYHFPLDLILAEMKGYLIGVTHYSKARRSAKNIAQKFGLAAEQRKLSQPAEMVKGYPPERISVEGV